MAQRQFRSDDSDSWDYGFGDGSDGALTISGNTTEAPIDSGCTGTISTTSLTATNASFTAGQLILIHQTRGTGMGQWELNKISSYATGTITTSHSLIYSYASGAQVRVLKQYTDVTVNSGIDYTAKAWDGTVGGIIAWLSTGTTTITGNVVCTGKGLRGGTSNAGNLTDGYAGENQTRNYNGTNNTTAENGSAGGGGAGSAGSYAAGGGGGGGHGVAGSDGEPGQNSDPGIKGGTDGSASLVDMVTGGGGGGGGGLTGSTTGDGGAGGGIILIIGDTITFTGTVYTKGDNGTDGAPTSPYSGGGGGAGGAVLLKGVDVTLGTNLARADGGAKGLGDYGAPGSDGGAGGAGRIHIDYSNSISGTTTPTLDSTNDVTIVPAVAASGGAFLFNFI